MSEHRDQLQGLSNHTGKISALSILRSKNKASPANCQSIFTSALEPLNLSCPFFVFSPTRWKQSHQNQINSIISHLKKNLLSPPLTPYTSPVIATICLLLSTVKFPQRFFYPNCLHFPHFQFTLQPVLPDFRCHHSSETVVVRVNNLLLPDAIVAVPSSPFWELRADWQTFYKNRFLL